MVVVVLVAFALRAVGLGDQSFWFDEALSVDFAGTPTPDLFGRLANFDIHPPLYIAMLHLWIPPAGISEYALRYLALLAGVLAVTMTYRLGAFLLQAVQTPSSPQAPVAPSHNSASQRPARVWRLSFPSPPLIAATLVAGSGILVRFSQENRDYSLFVFATLLATYAFARLLWKPSVTWRDAALYGVALAFAGYAHYLGWLIFPAHAAVLVLTKAGRARLALVLLGWWVTALAYLPWLPGALAQASRLRAMPDFWQGTLDVRHTLLTFVATIVSSGALDGRRTALVIAVAGVLLVVSLLIGFWQWRSEGRWHGGMLLLLLSAASNVGIVLAVVARNPKFSDRYMIGAVAFAVLVGAGVFDAALGWLGRPQGPLPRIRALGRVVIGFGVVLLMGGSLMQGAQPYAAPDSRKDDARGVVRYMQAHHQDGDAVLLMQDWSQAFRYYAGDSLGTEHVDWEGFIPRTDFATAAAELNKLAEGHKRLWLAKWHADWADPAWFVDGQLRQHADPLGEPCCFQGYDLALFRLRANDAFDASPEPARLFSVSFSVALKFSGGRVLYDSNHYADLPIHIESWWQKVRPIDDSSLWVSLWLTRNGVVWGQRDVELDTQPLRTPDWPTDQPMWREFDLTPFQGAPPGEYEVGLGLYSHAKNAALPAFDQNHRNLGMTLAIDTVMVGPYRYPLKPADIVAQYHTNETLTPNVALVGYDERTDSSTKPELKQGERFYLTLFWQARQVANSTPDATIVLEDAFGNQVLSETQSIIPAFPLTRWKPGDIYRDPRWLMPPATVATGTYRVVLKVSGSPGVSLGSLTVNGREHVMTAPVMQHALQRRFGDVGELMGMDLELTQAHPGGYVGMTFYWRALGTSTVSYKVFVHLLNAANQVDGRQDDTYPALGTAPTTSWVAGEWITDTHKVPIPVDTPPGAYQIEVGLYDLDSSKRVAMPDGATRVLAGEVDIP